ncbi:hypothetical protein VIGAN_05194800 [Vigna angularis var. angularis]|uniref:25S rRNA (uridine-N(3))-methyltransferase BMT5-like domain-containing protein n=1 Tax=Vigna angularis var. angularis TaxID=157739 RepID=A0A0S3S6K6_PHAAN|nr:hypothetical protein VIGAN_05194800 [Vigna angularis var. angularis]
MEESKKQRWQTIQEDEEDNAKWVTHYSSHHQILLVGEGDFSFSLSLAKSFGSAANIVASSLNPYDNVTKMYKQAKSNLEELHKLGAFLLHGVDATKMKLHPDLKMRRFDRVIFNFPHAGFHGREDSSSMIEMHKALVHGFFNNASRMLRANGEIHISHKTTEPFSYWDIENLAAQCFLTLIERADFKIEDYSGYNNKRGDAYRCDEPFPLGKCCTFKFVYIPEGKRSRIKRMMVPRHNRNLQIEEIEYAVEQLPTSAHLNYFPTASHFLKLKEETSFTGVHSSNMTEVHGRGFPPGGYSSLGMSRGPPRTFQPWPASANVRYSLTDHIRTMETVPEPLYTRRILQPMEESQSLQPGPTSPYIRYSLTDHIRTMETVPESLYTRRTLQPMEERQSLPPGPTSPYIRYSLTDHIRTMETVPESLYTRRTLQPIEERQSLPPEPTSAHIRYSLTDHIRTMETVPEPLYTRRTLQPMEERQSLPPEPTSAHIRYSLTDHIRTMKTFPESLYARRTWQPMEPLQSLQPGPTSAKIRYFLTDHIRKMETVPEPLYTRRTVQPLQHFQSLLPGRTSTDVRFSLTDHGRTMEAIRVSPDARNEGYWVNGGR